MAADLRGLLFHAGIGQWLPTAGLILRRFDFHSKLFQQQQCSDPRLWIELVNVTWNKKACLHKIH
jgi:hypothetical protein